MKNRDSRKASVAKAFDGVHWLTQIARRSMSRFLRALHSGRVLLMDGAMGTELQRAGLRQGERGELWNLERPERVRAIHQAYVNAGAKCLLTNTFLTLSRFLVEHH